MKQPKSHDKHGNFAKGNKIGVQFKKGGIPNPKGRPRTSFKQVKQYLLDAGVTPLSRREMIETYEMVFNATERQLQDIALDPDVPYVLRIIISELNDKKGRMVALRDLRDYIFGKATENRNVNVNLPPSLFYEVGKPALTEGEIIDLDDIKQGE